MAQDICRELSAPLVALCVLKVTVGASSDQYIPNKQILKEILTFTNLKNSELQRSTISLTRDPSLDFLPGPC